MWQLNLPGAGFLGTNELHIQVTEDDSGLRMLGYAKHKMHLALGLGNNWHRMVRFFGAFGPEAERVEAVGSEGLPLKSQPCPLSRCSEPVGPATGSILGDFSSYFKDNQNTNLISLSFFPPTPQNSKYIFRLVVI